MPRGRRASVAQLAGATEENPNGSLIEVNFAKARSVSLWISRAFASRMGQRAGARTAEKAYVRRRVPYRTCSPRAFRRDAERRSSGSQPTPGNGRCLCLPVAGNKACGARAGSRSVAPFSNVVPRLASSTLAIASLRRRSPRIAWPGLTSALRQVTHAFGTVITLAADRLPALATLANARWSGDAGLRHFRGIRTAEQSGNMMPFATGTYGAQICG